MTDNFMWMKQKLNVDDRIPSILDMYHNKQLQLQQKAAVVKRD
jgi:hypothetical protein